MGGVGVAAAALSPVRGIALSDFRFQRGSGLAVEPVEVEVKNKSSIPIRAGGEWAPKCGEDPKRNSNFCWFHLKFRFLVHKDPVLPGPPP